MYNTNAYFQRNVFVFVTLIHIISYHIIGNNFFKECGDVFGNVLVVENLDKQSELQLMQTYAPDVDVEILKSIATTFEQLRDAYSGNSENAAAAGK